jgi:DNA-binding NarL/FixJ family response regulator
MMPIRVLLVDDHAFFRRSLQRLLEADAALRVAASATDGREALELAVALAPDVVVMDIQMPRLDGVTASRAIKDARTAVKVLLYSAHEEHLERASLASAADGYLRKDDVFTDLIPRIHRLMELTAPGVCAQE